LKAAVELTVGDLCGEVGSEVGVEFSRELVATLSLVVVGKIERTATDLEAFAGHARRSTIQTEDVKLLTRRNTELTKHLTSQSIERIGANAEKKAAVAAKRKAKNDEKGKSKQSNRLIQ